MPCKGFNDYSNIIANNIYLSLCQVRYLGYTVNLEYARQQISKLKAVLSRACFDLVHMYIAFTADS